MRRLLTEQRALSTLDVMEVVAVLALVGGVGVVEGQAVPACLQRGDACVTAPVLVAALIVREEARQLVRTLETVLAKC